MNKSTKNAFILHTFLTCEICQVQIFVAVILKTSKSIFSAKGN